MPQTPGNQANELVDLVRTYPKARYQSLMLQQITRLYVALRGLLSDQLREIGFCRHRLTELLDLLQAPAGGRGVAVASDRCLLSSGRGSLDDAIAKLDDSVSQTELFAFDQQVQELLQSQFRALVNVCMAPSSVIKELAPALLHEAEAFLQARLTEASVVDLYLDPFDSDDEEAMVAAIQADLASAFNLACPELSDKTSPNEISVIAVPDGTRGDALRDLAARAFPAARIVVSDLIDEVLFYREDPQLRLNQIDQLGPSVREAYRQG